MPSKQRDLVIQFSQITDALLIALVFRLAHLFREELVFRYPEQFSLIAPFGSYKWLYLVILPVWPILLDINGFYTRSHALRRRDTLWILVKSVSLSALVVIAVMYFFQRNVPSRGVIMLFAGFSIVALYIKDAVFQAYLRAHGRSGKFARPILLVGPSGKNLEFEQLLA